MAIPYKLRWAVRFGRGGVLGGSKNITGWGMGSSNKNRCRRGAGGGGGTVVNVTILGGFLGTIILPSSCLRRVQR